MERSAKAIIAIVVAMLSIAAIFFYAGSIVPIEKAPGDISAQDEGKLVLCEGVVKDPFVQYGSASFELVDPLTGGTVLVYVPFALPNGTRASLVSGASVKVRGTVESYKDRPEVKVSKVSDIEVLAPPEANRVPLGVIMGNRDVFEDMTLVVQGKVQDLSFSWGDAYFNLSNGQFKATCHVDDFSPQVPFSDGSSVKVVGRAWFDEEGRLHISAKGWQAITVEL